MRIAPTRPEWRSTQIPAYLGLAPQDAAGASGLREEVSGVSGPGPRKVLVVDDERDLADMAAALLGGHGLGVTVAYSAQQALDILQSDRDIDAVFSDIMMPQTTGLQLAKTVEDLYPHIRIVLASGYTYPALLSECGRTYPYLAKPYRIDAVLKLLRSGSS